MGNGAYRARRLRRSLSRVNRGGVAARCRPGAWSGFEEDSTGYVHRRAPAMAWGVPSAEDHALQSLAETTPRWRVSSAVSCG